MSWGRDACGHGACRCVLSLTSLWLLVPVATCGARRWAAVVAAAAALVSVVTWSPRVCASPEPIKRAWIAWDRRLARLLFACYAASTPSEDAAFPCLVTLLYVASRTVQERNVASPLSTTCTHLLFRYVGYLWSTRVLGSAPFPQAWPAMAASHTVVYVLHIALLVEWFRSGGADAETRYVVAALFSVALLCLVSATTPSLCAAAATVPRRACSAREM